MSIARFIKGATASSVDSIALTDCFSDDYQVYKVTISPIDFGSADLFVRFINNAGSIVDESNYRDAVYLQRSYGAFVQNQSDNVDGIGSIGFSDLSNKGSGTTMYVFKPADPATHTLITWQNAGASSSGTPVRRGVGELEQLVSITGIRFHQSDILNISVNVYGIREE